MNLDINPELVEGSREDWVEVGNPELESRTFRANYAGDGHDQVYIKEGGGYDTIEDHLVAGIFLDRLGDIMPDMQYDEGSELLYIEDLGVLEPAEEVEKVEDDEKEDLLRAIGGGILAGFYDFGGNIVRDESGSWYLMDPQLMPNSLEVAEGYSRINKGFSRTFNGVSNGPGYERMKEAAYKVSREVDIDSFLDEVRNYGRAEDSIKAQNIEDNVRFLREKGEGDQRY